jgi:hypothetical protein
MTAIQSAQTAVEQPVLEKDLMKRWKISQRQLNTLAHKGRLHKLHGPKPPGAKHPVIMYSAESVAQEETRRGKKQPPEPAAPFMSVAAAGGGQPYYNSFGKEMAEAQVDAFKGLSSHLAKLSEVYGKPEADFADDAYVTVAEASAIKRMPGRWILDQIENGTLAYTRTPRNGIRILRGDLRTMRVLAGAA